MSLQETKLRKERNLLHKLRHPWQRGRNVVRNRSVILMIAPGPRKDRKMQLGLELEQVEYWVTSSNYMNQPKLVQYSKPGSDFRMRTVQ